MLGLLAPYARQLGIALAVVLLLGGTYYMGYSHEKAKLEAYIAQVEALGKAQEDKVKQITKEQQRINSEAANVYQANLTAIRTHYRSRLLNSTSGSPVSEVPPTSSGTDGIPSYTVLSGQCAETTVQLTSLQKWVKDQAGVE